MANLIKVVEGHENKCPVCGNKARRVDVDLACEGRVYVDYHCRKCDSDFSVQYNLAGALVTHSGC